MHSYTEKCTCLHKNLKNQEKSAVIVETTYNFSPSNTANSIQPFPKRQKDCATVQPKKKKKKNTHNAILKEIL